VKTIAIEEHFTTPMYRGKVSANEFRNFYLTSRSEQLGHNIAEQNADLGAQRLANMDAAGIDIQVLSFGSPGPQAFGAADAIPTSCGSYSPACSTPTQISGSSSGTSVRGCPSRCTG
jgi:predicted TIM-barrel fold metal-dependent hydrolase